MKKRIPFDIKYRPQIESGEYKVETRDRRPVRIICWDRKNGYPIVALATEVNGNESYINCYSDGKKTIHSQQFPSDLFLVTPEPELTEFEQELSDIVEYCKKHGENVADSYAVRHAQTLLELAREELCRQGFTVEKQKEQKSEVKYVPKFKKGDVIEPIASNGSYTPVRVRSVDVDCGSYICRSDDDKAWLSLPIRREDEYKLVEQKHDFVKAADESKQELTSFQWAMLRYLQEGANAKSDEEILEITVRHTPELLREIDK